MGDSDVPEPVRASGEERVRALLDAVVAIGGDLDPHSTLERIVAAAARLADARYVALGVLDRTGEALADFITYGIAVEQRKRIGSLPRGHGILGLLISDARPLRLHNLNEHVQSYGFPAHHPPMTSFLGVPVRVGNRVFGNLYLTEKRGGGDFTDDDENALVALAAAAGVAVENARLFEDAHRRARWLEATAEVQKALLRRVDRADALSLVAANARAVARADVALLVLEQDDGMLRVETVDGSLPDLHHVVLSRRGALADVVDHGATVHLGPGVRIPGVDVATALLVPFTDHGGAGGALLVGTTERRTGRWLGEDDIQALRMFAAQVAITLDRAQAQEDRGTLAVLADRDRIARDLHDLVIQRLFATGLTLQAVVPQLSSSPDAVARIHSAVESLDDTIRDIRGTIFDLHQHDDDTTLVAQVRAAVLTAAASGGTLPRLVLDGPLDSVVPDRLRPHLVAVLVEALSNATRHAEAEHIDVRVLIETEPSPAVLVVVTDDGRGFTATVPESGLRNLRERAQLLNGSLEVTTAPGKGTTIRWRAPLD